MTNDQKAPRVSADDLEREIASEHYFTADDGARTGFVFAGRGHLPHGLAPDETIPESLKRLTFCVLVLRNGFTVTGESACVSAENFDAETGRKIAREKAVEKLWLLLGWRLADRLHAEKVVQSIAADDD